MSNISLSDLESRLEHMFSRLPPLPADVKNLIVSYGPFLCLAAGILSIAVSGVLNMYIFSPSSIVNAAPAPIQYASVLLSIVIGIIFLTAFKPLKNRQAKGWKTLFYVTLLYAALSLLSLRPLEFLFALVALYILFQVKEAYL